MANPPKPIEQKRRTGNPGKRKLPDGSSLAAVPAIPAELVDLEPGESLDRVLAAGVHWIAATDSPVVGLLREAIEDYQKCRGLGDIKLAIELRKQIASLLSQLGFDPTARSRLGLAEVKAKTKLEELRERQSRRGA